MNEWLLLLVLLTGGAIGWLIRTWFVRRERIEQLREQQLARLEGSTSRGSMGILQARLAQYEESHKDLTQSFSLKDNEIDELYQVASKVKPLEFELAKAQAEIRRLENQTTRDKGTATAESGTDPEAEGSHQRINELEQQLAEAQRDLESFRNDQTLAFAALPDQTQDRDKELDQLYKEVSRIKPLEQELRRKDETISFLNRNANNDTAATEAHENGFLAGQDNDRLQALQAEIEDLKASNAELLEARESGETRLLAANADMDEMRQHQLTMEKSNTESGTRLEELQEKVRVRDIDIQALRVPLMSSCLKVKRN